MAKYSYFWVIIDWNNEDDDDGGDDDDDSDYGWNDEKKRNYELRIFLLGDTTQRQL